MSKRNNESFRNKFKMLLTLRTKREKAVYTENTINFLLFLKGGLRTPSI